MQWITDKYLSWNIVCEPFSHHPLVLYVPVPVWKRVSNNSALRSSRFPKYLFVSDKAFAQSAGWSMASRFSEDALRHVILDSHLLSLTNFLVCTFSSNVRVGGGIIYALSGSHTVVPLSVAIPYRNCGPYSGFV